MPKIIYILYIDDSIERGKKISALGDFWNIVLLLVSLSLSLTLSLSLNYLFGKQKAQFNEKSVVVLCRGVF